MPAVAETRQGRDDCPLDCNASVTTRWGLPDTLRRAATINGYRNTLYSLDGHTGHCSGVYSLVDRYTQEGHVDILQYILEDSRFNDYGVHHETAYTISTSV